MFKEEKIEFRLKHFCIEFKNIFKPHLHFAFAACSIFQFNGHAQF